MTILPNPTAAIPDDPSTNPGDTSERISILIQKIPTIHRDMQQKHIIISMVPLLIAGAFAIYKIKNPSSQSREAGKPDAVRDAGAQPDEKRPSSTPFGASAPVSHPELVGKYGEVKTKQARRVASTSVQLFRGGLGMSGKVYDAALSSGNTVKSRTMVARLLELEDSDISFTDQQQEKAIDLLKKHQRRRAEQAGEALEEMSKKPDAIMEFLLAADACANGSGNTDENDRLRSELQARLQAVDDPMFLKLTLGLGSSKADGPWSDPELKAELFKLLEPGQFTSLEKHWDAKSTGKRPSSNKLVFEPRKLEDTQEMLKKAVELGKMMGMVTEGLEGLEESGAIVQPDAEP